MTKFGWGLLVALLASNAAWIATAPAAQPVTEHRVPPKPLPAVTSAPRVANARSQRAPESGHEWARSRIAAARQIDDGQRRARAFEELREALGAADPLAAEGALIAFSALWQVRFDKQSFQPLILAQLRSPTPAVRRAALGALPGTKCSAAEVETVLAMAGDPESWVRGAVLTSAARMNGGDFEGAAGAVAIKLLADPDAGEFRGALVGVGRMTKASPALADRIYQLAEDKRTRGQVLQFTLLNAPKSKRMIDAMLRYFDEGVVEVPLDRGIPDEHKDHLALELLARLETITEEHRQQALLRFLRKYADARHREALQRLLDSKRFSSRRERQIRKILGALR